MKEKRTIISNRFSSLDFLLLSQLIGLSYLKKGPDLRGTIGYSDYLCRNR